MALDLLIAAAAVFLLRLFGPADLIPDSYDIAAVGECFWLNKSQWIDCNEATMGFRPLAPAVLMGPLLTLTGSLNSLSILCTLSILIFFVSLQQLMQNRLLSAVVCTVIITMPMTQQLLGLMDARVIVLGPLMWAYLKASSQSPQYSTNLFIGLAAAFVALSRPEQLLSVAFILLWVKGLSWKAIATRLTGALIPIAIWIADLSHHAGQLILAPRHWEGWILEQTELPLRWSQQLYGMGVWSPPLRDIAIAFPSPPQPTVGLSLWDGLQWISHAFFNPSLMWFVAGAVFCFVGIIKNTKEVRTMLPILAFMLPNLVATIYPQARDPLFAHSNLIPSILGLVVLGLIGFAHLIERVKPYPLKISLAVGLMAATLLSPSPLSPLPQIHNTEAGQSFIKDYKTIDDTTVIASFETAPLLHYTEQKWQQHPSPFEERPSAKALIYSHLDTQIVLPKPIVQGKSARLESAYVGESDQSWVIVYRLEDINQ